MFEQFSGQARRAVYLAYEEAHRLKQECVGTEHLLVGVLNEGSEGIGKLLTACGLDPVVIRQKVGFLIPAGVQSPDWSKLPLTPGAKRTLDNAREEVARLNDSSVFPEHLLLAILRDPESTAGFVLSNLGLRYDKLRMELSRLPPAANRDSMLQAQPQLSLDRVDPSSRDLDDAISAKVLPDEPSAVSHVPSPLPEHQWPPTAPEQQLALVRRQLLALKTAVGGFAGAWVGWSSMDLGGAWLGFALGCVVAHIPYSIVTTIIGGCAGAALGFHVWIHDPKLSSSLPQLGGIVGMVFGFCMGKWEGQLASRPRTVNPRTGPRSVP